VRDDVRRLLNPKSKNVRRWKHHWFGSIGGQRSKKTCFVMMPFAPDWADAVWKTIHESFGHEGINCIRADIMPNEVILNDIIAGISKSELLLADVTGSNPNVFYEVGIAHAWELDVLMIGQKGMQIPFDTGHIRHVMYDPSNEGLKKLGFLLRQIIREKTNPDITPSNIDLIEVDPAFSSNRQLIGQWEGTWSGEKPGSLPHTLVVYEIQSEKVSVAYFSGNLREWGVEAGYRFIFGKLVNGELIIEWPKVRITYALGAEELIGERIDSGKVFSCKLKKIRSL
jgi:hypothetical protein